MGGVIQLDAWEPLGIRVTNGDVSASDSMSPIKRALAETEERVVLDLHVGDRYQTNSNQWRPMPPKVTMRPGGCIRVAAAEHFAVPKSVFGVICSRASFAADGLYVSNIKVDPQFSGWLEVAVYNASRERIVIARGMAFASLFFLSLDKPMTEDLPRIPTRTKAVNPPSWSERVRRVAPFVITAAVSIGGSLSAAEIWNLIH